MISCTTLTIILFYKFTSLGSILTASASLRLLFVSHSTLKLTESGAWELISIVMPQLWLHTSLSEFCLHNADRSGLFHASQPQGKSWSASPRWEMCNRSDCLLTSRGTFKSFHMPTHILLHIIWLCLTFWGLALQTGLYKVPMEAGLKRFFFITQSREVRTCSSEPVMYSYGWWS